MNHKLPITGGIIALFLGTACCWIPALIIVLGTAAGLTGLNESLQAYSGLFLAAGLILISLGLLKYFKQRKTSLQTMEVTLESTITCPNCEHQKTEAMPTDSCQYFYECSNCRETIKPKEGDCCVYCSYGDTPCPPIQQNKACC